MATKPDMSGKGGVLIKPEGAGRGVGYIIKGGGACKAATRR